MLYSIFVHSGITIYWCTTVFNFTYLADLALSSCCTPFLCTVVSKLAHTAGKHQIKIRHEITDVFSRIISKIDSREKCNYMFVSYNFFLLPGIALYIRNINYRMSIQYTYNIYSQMKGYLFEPPLPGNF